MKCSGTTQTLQGRCNRLIQVNLIRESTQVHSVTVFQQVEGRGNVINPTSMTIFSSTRNTDTSTFPTSQQFGSPTNRTDNITSRTYTEHFIQGTSGNKISLSGDRHQVPKWYNQP